MRAPSLLFGLALAALAAGSARAETRSYQLPHFDSVSVATGISAIVETGGAEAVSAEAPNAAALDRLKVEVHEGQLRLSIDGNFVNWFFNLGQRKPIVVHVAAPAIKAAEASSGADLDLTLSSAEAVSIGASSGASVAATLGDTAKVSIDVSSGASLGAKGTCGSLIANVSTGGTFSGRDMVCDSVNTQASTGGHAEVHATHSVNANASVGGSVAVYGNPADSNINSGTGGSVTLSP